MVANNLGHYLLYAIGEVALIIIGILIALSISNQNEERKERKEEEKILLGIKDDFEETRSRLKETIKMQEMTLNYSRTLINLIELKDLAVPSDSIATCLGFGAFSYWRAEPVTGSYDALIGAGNTSIIRDKELLNALADFSSVSKLPFEDEVVSMNLIQLMQESIAEYHAVLEGDRTRGLLELSFRYPEEEKRKAIEKLFRNKAFLAYLIGKNIMELNRLRRHTSLLAAANLVLVSLKTEGVPQEEEQVKKFLGNYALLDRGDLLKITNEGHHLFGQVLDYPRFELIYFEPNLFYIKNENSKIQFQVNNGEIIGCSVFHNGIEDRYEKK